MRDRAQLYGAKSGDYTTQLQALERAAKNHPDDPDEQFLLAYHYALSSRSADATPLLDKVLKVAPENSSARALRDTVGPRFALSAAQPPARRSHVISQTSHDDGARQIDRPLEGPLSAMRSRANTCAKLQCPTG